MLIVASKQKSEFVLDSAAWPAILVDEEGRVRRANPAAGTTFPLPRNNNPMNFSSVWALDNEETFEQFWDKWLDLPESVLIKKFRMKGGGTRQFVFCITPVYYEGQRHYLMQMLPESLMENKDQQVGAPSITTEKPVGAQTELSPTQDFSIQKQKLDCALQLIRTVVLDFNNALTSILGHSSFLLSKIGSDSPWRRVLVEIEKSAEKAAEVANDLAAFTRQDKSTINAGNLNDLIRRSIEIFQTPAYPRIMWVIDLEKRIYTVNFDEAKMQQVFVKLIENAVQAIQPDGQITVRSRNMDLSDTWQDGAVTLKAGTYVCIEINDNGCGIPPEILPRIFEPFFTTKQGHRGLGLAWVYGIVTNHGGSVVVSSQPGQGTSVRVYLPAQRRFVRDHAFKIEELIGSETVLVVDDEELLLTMMQTVLSEFGYQVITANNGQNAIDILSRNGIKVDLVITDLVMPGISGRELIEKLKGMIPGLKFLCCSGYIRPGSNKEGEIYLQKPFTTQELLKKVKQALAS